MEEQTSLNREAKQRKRQVEPLPAAAAHTPSSVLALIERVTLDPCAGVETRAAIVATAASSEPASWTLWAFMYLRNFGPTLAFLIRSTMVWV